MNDAETYRRHSQWLTQMSTEYRRDAHKTENHRNKQAWLKRADEFEDNAAWYETHADELERIYGENQDV